MSHELTVEDLIELLSQIDPKVKVRLQTEHEDGEAVGLMLDSDVLWIHQDIGAR